MHQIELRYSEVDRLASVALGRSACAFPLFRDI